MNIIYVVEDFSENGGVERIVSEKANTLSTRYHHQVTIISVYNDTRPERYTLDRGVGLVHLHVPFAQKGCNPMARLFSRTGTLFTAVNRLNKALGHLHPDIIFFTTTLGALLLPFCSSKARLVYESHLARNFNPFNRLFLLTELRAERVICLTQGDARQFGHARRVDIIPNFINPVTSVVADYGVKKALAVGRLEHQKGFDILIRCWKQLVEQFPQWQLHIYGEGSCRDDLQQQIVSLHLENNVCLCGRHDNIMQIYPQYSLHLMTSRYEGLPMTLIEAQACGLPSVVFDFLYGARDIVINAHNGYIVPQADDRLFIEVAAKMMSSETTRKAYGKNAFEEGKRYYKESIFNRWLNLIENK